jgi:glycosyltransferase involved in cell wall biosynthesis
MGRYVRPLLRALATRADITLTLLVRDPRRAADYRAIVGTGVDVAPLSSARISRAYDRVWYPWNGVRFAARAPAVVTINDDFAFAYPARGRVARWREQQPIRRAARRAAHLLTISHWSRDALRKRFDLAADRISVIPLAPDAFFSPGSETSPFGEPFVLAVGTGDERKNIAFLIDVFARAFPLRDVRLVLVGAPSPAITARLEGTRLPTAILTQVGDDALRRLYRTAATVAIPSLAEGFGLVAAEAQACGAAVIAANTSALPEAVGDAGLLIDPRDADAWRDGLLQLVHDPQARARYTGPAAARWASVRRDAMLDALLAALERCGDDGA